MANRDQYEGGYRGEHHAGPDRWRDQQDHGGRHAETEGRSWRSEQGYGRHEGAPRQDRGYPGDLPTQFSRGGGYTSNLGMTTTGSDLYGGYGPGGQGSSYGMSGYGEQAGGYRAGYGQDQGRSYGQTYNPAPPQGPHYHAQGYEPGAQIWRNEGGRGFDPRQEPGVRFESNVGDFEPDYLHWRETQLRNFDRDYHSWREERRTRFADDFHNWRKERDGRNASAGQPVQSATTQTSPQVRDVSEGGTGHDDKKPS